MNFFQFYLTFLGLSLAYHLGFSQTLQPAHFPVYQGSSFLQLPWAGGLNNPQFSPIDLNNDGKQDFIAFDRSDERILTFIQENNQWVYAPQFEAAFPDDSLKDWVLLRDMDCDNDLDLFTGANSNVRVFKNLKQETGTLQFTLAYDRLYSLYTNTNTFLYAAGIDISGITDVDGDSDLDFLVFDVTGTLIEYHKNRAIEDYGRCDTMVLVKTSNCWGHFSEYYNALTQEYLVTLNQPPCGPGQKTDSVQSPEVANLLRTMHIGGTLLPLNLNGDTLVDCIIGDVGINSLVSVTNGGTRQIAHMIAKDESFPSYNQPVNLTSFPAGFYLDADFDQKADLWLAPNTVNGTEDRRSVQLYGNSATSESPVFYLKSTHFLQNEMIETGTGAVVNVFDWNKDGLKDLLIGNRNRFENGNAFNSLMLLVNIGTNNQPAFRIHSDDYLGLNTNQIAQIQGDFAPTTGDLDGDGDDDLLLGITNGKLWYFQNLGTDTAQFFLQTTDYFGIDHGLRSVPQLRDYDNDGDLDLFIGYDNGRITLYQNTGSPTSPNWALITTQWGKIRYQNPQISIFGNAKPFLIDADADGQLELFLGTIDGYILIYDNLTYNATDSFEVSGIFANKDWGMNASITAFPYGGNDSIAWFIGGQRGGIEAWKSSPNILSSGNPIIQNPFQVYPNPAQSVLCITFFPLLKSVHLHDLTGRKIELQQDNGQVRLPLLSNGMYLLELQHLNQQRFYQKIWIHQD